MHHQSANKHAAQAAACRAIELLGGPVDAARKCGAPSYQAVQSWRESGIPAKFCRKVQEETGMCLSVLRPDDWHLIWPELAASTKTEVA